MPLMGDPELKLRKQPLLPQPLAQPILILAVLPVVLPISSGSKRVQPKNCRIPQATLQIIF